MRWIGSIFVFCRVRYGLTLSTNVEISASRNFYIWNTKLHANDLVEQRKIGTLFLFSQLLKHLVYDLASSAEGFV